MKYKEAVRKLKNIEDDGNSVENNIIRGIDVTVIGHFGNAVSLNIWCDNCSLFHDYNNTSNIGYQIRALAELFDLTEEDGFSLNSVKNVPCRIILAGDGGWGARVVGFGHFMKDKFIYKEDFARICE